MKKSSHQSSKSHPPKWANRFLEWYCRPELLEEIQGDIHEVFDKRHQTRGISAARRGFVWDVLRSFRLSTIKNKTINLSSAMFKNHFKVTIRHLLRQKFYTTIKVAGFALGLACCLLILIFIRHELSFDKYYSDADRIYRVLVDYHAGGEEGMHTITTTPLAKTLEQEFPEIEKAVRIAPYFAATNLVKKEGEAENVYEEGFIYADPGLLDMFDFPMIGGSTAALTQPFSIVLTASMAAKYFPKENPVGKLLILNNNTDQPFKVTGVMEDLPDNSHFKFNFILSMEGVGMSKIDNWGFSNFVTYVILNPQSNPKELEAKFPEIINKYIDPEGNKFGKEGDYMRFVLQPLKDIHLYSANVQGGDYARQGDIQYIWLFGAVALFVLLIASINFINLSTAKSANRAKEVGIRKVLGSFRKQLMAQFLTESVMLSILAVIMSLLLAWAALPYFNNLANQQLSLPLNAWWFIPALLLTALFIGLLSGLYPSVFLSSFKPVQVLKGKLNQGSKSGRLRSALVVIQFTTSIVLIVATLIVQQQMDYIQQKKLGFEKDQILIIEDTYALGSQVQPFKNALKKLAEVQNVSVSGYLPVDGYDRNGTGAWPEGNKTEEAMVGLAKWYVDHDYVSTLGMEIIQGRDFSVEFPSDSQAIILNKKAVELLGFTDPIGERVSSYTFLDEKTGELVYDTYTVVGVVEDFHFASMKNDIEGLSLVIGGNTGATMIKTKGTDVHQLIGKVNQIWESFAPTEPFRYNFLNERFANMYAFEQRVGKIFGVFAGLAIFVACLGLFALAAFMAEQRTKEISIRKVLGASISSIFMLLTKNFAGMILISLVLATPLAWYFMQSWLKDFVYRTTIGWEVFVIAGSLALCIALLTVSYQAFKSAILNPADTLRAE
jgi:putative ABC transport system permease protein